MKEVPLKSGKPNASHFICIIQHLSHSVWTVTEKSGGIASDTLVQRAHTTQVYLPVGLTRRTH